MAVSDPTQKNSSTIKIEIAMAVAGTLSVDPGVTVTALSPKVKLTVNVKNAGGRTFRARFQLPTSLASIALAGTGAEGRVPRVPIVPKQVRDSWNSSPRESYGSKLKAMPAPTLTVRRTGADKLIVSWPSNCGGYRLQSRTNITDLSLEWVDVPGGTASPAIIPISKTSPGAFFRLKSP